MKLTPAYANYRFTPEPYHKAREPKSINLAAIIKSKDLKILHRDIKIELKFIRNQINHYYDPKRIKGLSFSEGDIVYLATKNISIKQPSKKLNYKYIRLYKILQKISENNYKLDLPPKVRLYLIVYITLLESAADIIQVKIGNKPEEIKGPKVYEAEKIRKIRKENGRKEYLVK
jgi:hypothetical protein